MPDIAMCNNNHCVNRRKCYRYMAEPKPTNQSYGDFRPTYELVYQCDYFTPIKEGDRITDKE